MNTLNPEENALSQLQRPYGFEMRGGDNALRHATARVFAQNPRLGDMRTIISTGTGPYPVEAFPATEPDNPFYGEGRPAIKFNTNKTAPWATTEQMIEGEHLHFLTQDDPEFRSLKRQFVDSFDADQMDDLRWQYEQARERYGEQRPFETWVDRSWADQAIHAVMLGRGEDYAGGFFTPAQEKIAAEVRSALRKKAPGG
jgi:hypothetical protein